MTERGQGQTKAMVMALEENTIVIVHTRAMETYLRRMVADLRGAEFSKSIRARVVRTEHDVELLARGPRDKIVVDHAWYGCASARTWAFLHEIMQSREIAAGQGGKGKAESR